MQHLSLSRQDRVSLCYPVSRKLQAHPPEQAAPNSSRVASAATLIEMTATVVVCVASVTLAGYLMSITLASHLDEVGRLTPVELIRALTGAV